MDAIKKPNVNGLPQGYTEEQLLQHYEIEKELAGKLLRAPFLERRVLYSSLYDELFKRVTWHPQLQKKESGRNLLKQMQPLQPYLKPDSVLLEIGAGDCALSFAAAKQVKKVYALDVSDVITQHKQFPENVELILSDGVSVPLPENSVDIAYSNQLMEHLHPEDALKQLSNIQSVLKPGGIYICITPNRISGPHDISRYFDDIASGFHLKEYTFEDMKKIFREAGFNRVAAITKIPFFPISPLFPYILLEKWIRAIPRPWRKSVARQWFIQRLLYIRILAVK